MFLPPVLRPLAAVGPVNAAVQRIAETPFSVVRGTRGSYVAERLAGAIDSWERLQDCVWLRARDGRPVELTQSLATACRHRWSSGAGTDVQTDAGLRLSEEIRAAPPGAVIVIELGGRLTTGVARLVKAIRPATTDRGVSVVVVAESRFHPPSGRAPDWVASASDLFDPDALDGYSCAWNRARLLRYVGPRGAVVHDVLAAGQLWSQDVVAEALDAAHGLPSFLNRLTAVLLGQLTPDQRSALEVASLTGYWHPQLGTRPVAAEQLRPWLVPLERQWGWLRPIWASPLRRELARSAGSGQVVDGVRAAHAVTRPVAASAARIVPAARTAAQPGLLQARLLGPLEVRVDGAAVTSWNGQRGASVLRYLLSRRQYACSRDELLEEYWPEAPAGAAARNRLQVAVSGLRRAFRDVTALNVVEYADGRYRINREFRVEVDVDLFELSLNAAGAAERSGDREEARTAYHEAVALYRGDFAADAPFEQWTLLPRESLRIKLADALDRLSRLELADGRVDDCIATAHRMLGVDPCREDAHRLLMRCYAAQGRVYQALRQYEFCSRILKATVDADPAPDTTRLYRAIRYGSAQEFAGID
jgi:DNA-binding SARP family transcriptional activator